MKGVGNLLAMVGILLLIYSVVGRFVGAPTIGFGIIPIAASSGIIASNGIMLVGILCKLWKD